MTRECWIVFWILTSSEAFLLQGPDGPLVVQLGGSVLLPCSVETPLLLEELEVEWKRDSDELVHLFQEGEERPESQSYQYSGRAHFLTEGVTAGNYSLLLTNATPADAGIYICKVFTNLNSDEITAEIKYIERLIVTGSSAVSAHVGDEVTLNCSVDSHIPPKRLQYITWKRTDQEVLVLLYRDGEAVPNSTHERYQGRAEFFTKEIPSGNFSLRLKDVRPGDKGEYICEAHSGHLLASTTGVLQEVGTVPLLIMASTLCVIALALALGLGVPAFIQLMKKELLAAPKRYPAYVGKEVELKCDRSGLSGRITSVTWRRADQDVLKFQNRVVSPDSPDHKFQFTNVKKRNFALKLKKLTTEDEGIYMYEVHTKKKSKTNEESTNQSKTYTVALQVYNGWMMLIHCSLVLFPNIIIFIAFMLYGVKQGFNDEIVMCATVNFIRFLLVFKTAPYLEILPAYPKRYIKSVSILLQYIVVAGVLIAGVFANITATAGFNIFFLVFAFGFNIFYNVLDIIFDDIDVVEYWCFTYVDIINWTVLWLLVVGYATFNLSMFIITLAVTLVVNVLFRFQNTSGYDKWEAIATLLLIVLFPMCIITYFYYLLRILANKPEGPGLMCVSALLYSLTAISGFDHPKTAADIPIPHVLVYMFGAAALPLLNATALTADLVMKLGTGVRMLSDLQVVVLPCECVFVIGWLALQPYHYWIRRKEVIKQQLKEMSRKIRCIDDKSKES